MIPRSGNWFSEKIMLKQKAGPWSRFNLIGSWSRLDMTRLKRMRVRLERRIDEAAKILPLDQLAISPQCGFASSVDGNLLSEDEQKRKLERVVERARQVWGR